MSRSWPPALTASPGVLMVVGGGGGDEPPSLPPPDGGVAGAEAPPGWWQDWANDSAEENSSLVFGGNLSLHQGGEGEGDDALSAQLAASAVTALILGVMILATIVGE